MSYYLIIGVFAPVLAVLLVGAAWDVYEFQIRYDLRRFRSAFSRKQLPPPAPPPPQVTFLGTSEDGVWDIAVFDDGLTVRREVGARTLYPSWRMPGGTIVLFNTDRFIALGNTKRRWKKSGIA